MLSFDSLSCTEPVNLSIFDKEFFKERIQKERGEFSQTNDAFRIKIS